MLINARVPEELRIAIVDGDVLENYQVEVADRDLTRGNIYRGIIASIQPSLNAAFIDYGAERHGFLTIQDVVPAAYYREPEKSGRPRIDEVLEKGKPIVVQVTREPEGNKGAALTTNLSLAGRYLVLTPFDDKQGVSRKVEDEDTRKRLKEQVAKLDRPSGAGLIVRTNALDQNKTALNRDMNALLRLWKSVGQEARRGKGIQLLYKDQDIILRTLRDYLDTSIQEVLIDHEAAYDKTQQYMRAFMPRSKTGLVRYSERTPLFARFELEPQIERIYDRQVALSSGGSIVIDRTEALVAIDVNSGRSTRAASQEETALNTNLEAAGEVARQLRLRDIGGLIVVDFIDMQAWKNRRSVEKALRDAMKSDKARFTVGRISANGLLEVNRQRIQQDLHLRTHRACPTCSGTGRVASPEMVGLKILRKIEARAASGFTGTVRVSLHPELADSIQNKRRREIANLEDEFSCRVEIIASNRLHRSEEEVEWIEAKNGEIRVPKTPRAGTGAKRASLSIEDAAAPGEQSASTKKPASRRRRGRPSKSPKKAAKGQDAPSTDKAAQPSPAETSPASSGSQNGGADQGTTEKPAPSRRRRGGRGRSRRGGRKRKPAEKSTSTHAPESPS
jgi:ribonuclease E